MEKLGGRKKKNKEKTPQWHQLPRSDDVWLIMAPGGFFPRAGRVVAVCASESKLPSTRLSAAELIPWGKGRSVTLGDGRRLEGN